jgi:hypothetical protein
MIRLRWPETPLPGHLDFVGDSRGKTVPRLHQLLTGHSRDEFCAVRRGELRPPRVRVGM